MDALEILAARFEQANEGYYRAFYGSENERRFRMGQMTAFKVSARDLGADIYSNIGYGGDNVIETAGCSE